MRISAVILRVEDVERSKSFWSQSVGLDVVMDIPGFVFLDGEGIQLILSHLDRPVDDESLTEIVFHVDDVREAYSRLSSQGVGFENELRPITSDGERTMLGAHWRDPDGHYGSLTGWVDD